MTAGTSAPVALEPRATLPVPIDDALDATTEALKAEGFGVLTKIDVRATMQEKLGESFDPYLILGACNPKLAHTALSTDPDVGLLLPCNVVLHEQNGSTTVSILDPATMFAAAIDRPELEPVAREAGERLQRVASALAAQGIR
ncbi:MAG: DUF302 domain-containing protein [Thermomicrobiales bacterium]|nr:DUF302 domain-containing protein [Thermomicrobiales bacterium]